MVHKKSAYKLTETGLADHGHKIARAYARATRAERHYARAEQDHEQKMLELSGVIAALRRQHEREKKEE